MGWLVRFFKLRFGKISRSYRQQLHSVLSRLIPRDEFLILCHESSGSADLFERCAKKLLVDEVRLLSACAAMMNLEIVKRIPPVNVNLLPIELTIDRCREMLICPIIEGDVLTGYAVADPSIMSRFVKKYHLPLAKAYAATPKQILSTLADAEQGEDKKREAELCVDASKAEVVLREIAYQGITKGADEVVVFEESVGLLCYEASSQGRLAGKGKIATSMKGALSIWFKQHASDKVAFDYDFGALTLHVTLGFGNHLGILTLHSRSEQSPQSLEREKLFVKTSARGVKHPHSGITIDSLSEESELPRVLVVEDNPTLSRVIDRLLTTHGYQVTLAPHGGVALEMLEHGGTFDAVVCDIHMPKVDGLNFIKKVRSGAFHLPLIMLTSDIDPTIELRVLDLGADVFLTKDVDPELLLAHLKRRVGALRSIAAKMKEMTSGEPSAATVGDLHEC
jgi:CheY-like chemotaxis protein